MSGQQLEMVTDFTPRQIGRLFADRNLDYEEFFKCYSSRNPLSVNDCTDMCFDGPWLALAFRLEGRWIAMHHAADRSRLGQFCWTSGYWPEEYRGPRWHHLQREVWQMARTYFADRYARIYCVAYCHNPWADTWIRERCDFLVAAKILKGVVDHQGVRQDVWAYSQRAEDVGHCIETAQITFPDHGGIEPV